MTTSGEVKRRPIRGALWGLLLGVGVTALLIMYSVIAVGTLTPWVVLLVFIVLGVLWGLFGPAKRTRDLPPSQVRAVPTATTPPGKASQEAAVSSEGAEEVVADPFAAGSEAGGANAAEPEEADPGTEAPGGEEPPPGEGEDAEPS
jgi:hypothetical protein